MTAAINTSFVDLTDTSDIQLGDAVTKTKTRKKNNAEEAFIKAPMRVDLTDKSKYHIVVYNPYSHESVIAAAIMQNRFCKRSRLPDGSLSEVLVGNVKFVSYLDVIPTNGGTYIWLGVKPESLTRFKTAKEATVLKYDYSQPAVTVPREVGILGKLIGKNSITEEEKIHNGWYEFVNGTIDFNSDFHDPMYCSLIDKVMCDFGIEDIGNYGYRYLASLCKDWGNCTIDEDLEPVFFANIIEALVSLEQFREFRVRYGTVAEREAYLDLLKARYRILTNKTSAQRLQTLNGPANVSILSVDPEMFYIAHRHFGKNGMKYINLTHGMNGRLFVGNVRVDRAQFHDGEVVFVD